jgi:phage terminase large subunit
LVYENFDPNVNLWKRIGEPPHDWPHYWSVDFGFTNPFVWQDWTEDPDGRLFLFQEIYQTGRLVEDHAKEILRLQKVAGYKTPPVFIVCDHDAEGRATLEKELGYTTVAAHKSVLEGIEATASRMRLRADGRPGLYICRDAARIKDQTLIDVSQPTCTEEEMSEYIWGDLAKKEAPVKKNDHGMDAMRYLVAQLDLAKRPRVRWI